MKQSSQDFSSLLIERPVDGMWALRTLSQRSFETFLVELMDNVAHGLRITSQRAGYLVGVLASIAGEQDLAATQGEGIRRTQAHLQGLTLGLAQGTHVYWLSHTLEDNH
jgi:hypothetical protein